MGMHRWGRVGKPPREGEAECGEVPHVGHRELSFVGVRSLRLS